MERKLVFASGTRKRSKARVRLKDVGKGLIIVNGKDIKSYFAREDLIRHIIDPLSVVKMENSVDIIAKVTGGGKSGQAGAVRLAIARALESYDEKLRDKLRKYDLLTRDPRKKERMKYGKSKRRKSPQYSKR